jgi:hypothetical protein
VGSIPANHQSGHKAIEKSLKLGHFIKCNVVQKIDHSPVGCGWSCFNLTIYEGNIQYCWKPTTDFSVKMKRMRTVADSNSATSESDVE